MKTTSILLFTPGSAFKRCTINYEVAKSGRGYLYEIHSCHETIRHDVHWPVDEILQLNDRKYIDHEIAAKTQNEFSKAELGIDMTKTKPKKKSVVVKEYTKTEEEELFP